MATKPVVYNHIAGLPDNRVSTYKAKCWYCNAELSGHGKTTSK